MVTIGPLPNGCTLYREPNGVGGFRYWSDEIGGGVMVWDTALADPSTLLAAMTAEATRERAALVAAGRAAVFTPEALEADTAPALPA